MQRIEVYTNLDPKCQENTPLVTNIFFDSPKFSKNFHSLGIFSCSIMTKIPMVNVEFAIRYMPGFLKLLYSKSI